MRSDGRVRQPWRSRGRRHRRANASRRHRPRHHRGQARPRGAPEHIRRPRARCQRGTAARAAHRDRATCHTARATHPRRPEILRRIAQDLTYAAIAERLVSRKARSNRTPNKSWARPDRPAGQRPSLASSADRDRSLHLKQGQPPAPQPASLPRSSVSRYAAGRARCPGAPRLPVVDRAAVRPVTMS